MKPLVLLAACSLLGAPALVAASDYPPPTGPYRTPETLESLADQARAILAGLAPSKSTDMPDKRYSEPPRTFALDRAAAFVEPPQRMDPGPATTSGATDWTSVDQPRWKTWDQAGAVPAARKLPAVTQYVPAYESADSPVPTQRGRDGQPHYAQAPTAGWRPENAPYAPPDQYRSAGSPPDAGYYRAAPAGQGYRDPDSVPMWEYPTHPYREPFPVTRQEDRRASPGAWYHDPLDDQPASILNSGYYRQPSLRGQRGQHQAHTPEFGAYSSSPWVSEALPRSGAYAPEALSPAYSGMTGETGSHYFGVDLYPDPSRTAEPYLRGQATYAPAPIGEPAEPPVMSVPARKASYSQDTWPYGSDYAAEIYGNTVEEGAYGPAPKGGRSGYAGYPGGYLTPSDSDPMAGSAYYAPGRPSLRYRELEPSSNKFYYGDYEFAPLPASDREVPRQASPGQQPDPQGWYGGSALGQTPGRFRDTGQLPSEFTGPGGQVYRYRPLEDRHSAAPNARTWQSSGTDKLSRDYPNQSRHYRKDRLRDYWDQR